MRFATLFAALAAATLIAAPAPARTWKQEWTVGGHPGVEVQTNDARVRVHRGPARHVSATIEYTLETWGFHSRVQEPVLEFGRRGDVITISARSRANAVFFGGMHEQFTVDVTLPPECDVTVRSGDGSVALEPVSGTIDLRTGDGRLVVHGASGTVRLWTGDGGIDADSLDGTLEARTSDGHLRVAGRFDALDLKSGDGRIDASVARGSRLAKEWSVLAGDGGVTLRVPRNFAALLDVATNDGHVEVDLPIGGLAGTHGHSLRGQLNDGTVPLRVRSGDGSVKLTLSE